MIETKILKNRGVEVAISDLKPFIRDQRKDEDIKIIRGAKIRKDTFETFHRMNSRLIPMPTAG